MIMSVEEHKTTLRKEIALAVYPVIAARNPYSDTAAKEAVFYANALILELDNAMRQQ